MNVSKRGCQVQGVARGNKRSASLQALRRLGSLAYMDRILGALACIHSLRMPTSLGLAGEGWGVSGGEGCRMRSGFAGRADLRFVIDRALALVHKADRLVDIRLLHFLCETKPRKRLPLSSRCLVFRSQSVGYRERGEGWGVRGEG